MCSKQPLDVCRQQPQGKIRKKTRRGDEEERGEQRVEEKTKMGTGRGEERVDSNCVQTMLFHPEANWLTGIV